MASGPATPPAEEPPRGEERYGPLDVLRTHKGDGRSLILYSRAQDATDPGATPADESRGREA